MDLEEDNLNNLNENDSSLIFQVYKKIIKSNSFISNNNANQ